MRPRYHFAPAANWINDPNGLVWHGGRWHLFYQYNPHGDQWGHMAWGHATSTDLARWQEHDVALAEDERHMIFSGSAVADETGSAGFGRGALVAIYTGHVSPPAQHQVQCLAVSKDDGTSWTKFAGNPVLDRGMEHFRDPNVFWHDGSGQWVMVVALSEENCALIYASADLKDWRELSRIERGDAPGHLWECPMLIALPVEEADEERWLFKIDVMSGSEGSGAIGLVGQFDGQCFVPEPGSGWITIDHGRDFYAAIPWHAPRDPSGRPAWIGWMGNHAYQRQIPSRGQRGVMSLPRRLSLRRDAGGWDVIQQVEPAVEALFDDATDLRDGEIGLAGRIDCEGDNWSLRLDAIGGGVIVTRAAGTLTVERDAALHPAFDAPIVVTGLHGHDVRLWLDTRTLEIEADGGARWLGVQHCLARGGDRCTVTGKGSGRFRHAALLPDG